jgi:tetratricopeptide (TPR) repeat protein
MVYRTGRASLALGLASLMSIGPSGCGNAWITSPERENTLAAIMSRAEYAYDKSEFDRAVKYFSKALAKDPSYDDARIKLAYAINGTAGLNILDFVTRFIVKEEPTSGNNLAAASTSPLAVLTSTVGQSPDLIDALKAQAQSFTTVADVRAESERFRKLQDSWTTICPLIPSEVFASVFQTEASSLAELFPVSACQGGLSEGRPAQSAALFAAVLQFLAQAADLFQVILDADGDNEIDLAQKGTAAVNELNRLQQLAGAITDPLQSSPEQYTQSLQAITAQLDTVRALREQIGGEILNYTLACFTFITVLVSKIPNIPKEIAGKIEQAATKINAGRAKLTEYMTIDASSPNSTQGAKVKQAAQKAQQTIDSLYDKVNALPDGAEKTSRLAALNAQRDAVCNNFDATKAEFGLPDDVARPSNCPASFALAASKEQQPNHKEPRGVAQVYPLWRAIPLPSALNPELVSAEPLTEDRALGLLEARANMVEFVRFGEELRSP